MLCEGGWEEEGWGTVGDGRRGGWEEVEGAELVDSADFPSGETTRCIICGSERSFCANERTLWIVIQKIVTLQHVNLLF